jgi:glycosyltransferase involved in cell wall biosynthesis
MGILWLEFLILVGTIQFNLINLRFAFHLNPLKKISICHFSSVHKASDCRVFDRECKSLAAYFDVSLIGIGNENQFIDGVQVIGIKQNQHPIHRFFGSSFVSLFKAFKIDASVYHIHDAELIWAGILLSLTGKHVIYDIHENTSADIRYRKWLPKWSRPLVVLMYSMLMKLAKNYVHFIPVIAAESEIEKMHIQATQNYTVVQNYAELNLLKRYRVRNRFNKNLPTLIYVGRLRDYYYNIDPVLEAIYLLKKEGILVQFELIGLIEPQFLQGFEHLSFWKEIKDQVHFKGELDRNAWLEISMKTSIGICIKNQADGEVLSHERKLFEYIALGIPSIFCNKKIYTHLNEQFTIGISVDIANPNEVKNAIAKLFTDQKYYESLEENCIHAADHFLNWENEFEKLLNLYNEILSK